MTTPDKTHTVLDAYAQLGKVLYAVITTFQPEDMAFNQHFDALANEFMTLATLPEFDDAKLEINGQWYDMADMVYGFSAAQTAIEMDGLRITYQVDVKKELLLAKPYIIDELKRRLIDSAHDDIPY